MTATAMITATAPSAAGLASAHTTTVGTAETEHALRGVQRLAGAILLQALEDVRYGSGRRRTEAIQWMMDDGREDQFSFRFCCRVLNRNPEQVRRWALRIDFRPLSQFVVE